MKNEIFKKTIVIGLIVLFIGAGVASGVDLNIEQKSGVSEKSMEGNEIFISENEGEVDPYGQLNSAWIQIDDPEKGYLYVSKLKIPQLFDLFITLQIAVLLGDMFIETDWSGDIVSCYFLIINQQLTNAYDCWDNDSSGGFNADFPGIPFGFYDMYVYAYNADGTEVASDTAIWLEEYCAVFFPYEN